MDKKRAMSREEIGEAYRVGEEAVIALVEGLLERIEQLETGLAALETKIEKNSGNSSQPPSSDGLKRSKKRSLRGKSGKLSGGQAGHEGRTLKAVAEPDEVRVHTVMNCAYCQANLQAVSVSGVEKRQVFDLPEVVLSVTEHQAEQKVCPACGAGNRAVFPDEVAHATQYGARFRAQLAYFHSGQFIPLARTADMAEGLYGQPVSEATVVSAVQAMAQVVAPVIEALKTYLAESPEAVHSDETGARVEGKLYWVHSAGTEQATVYAVHPKRGTVGMDALHILQRRKGWSVHDGLPSYFKYTLKHALCNAHHLRELTFIHEQYGQAWAADLRHCLSHMNRIVAEARADGHPGLPGDQAYALARTYDRIRDQADLEISRDPPPVSVSKHRPKHTPAANLARRLRIHRPSVLAFMYDFSVPFDNNLAERDLRMVKVQQKVSGGFRSQLGAHAFCAVRSYLSTARKNGVSALSALVQAFNHTPFYPPCVSPAE